ncbi:Mitochondrial carrier [Caenorhabditis elegans]|uniref:Mitochondrial carrier n=1 Tax=Caenorhabditis elegans TaxID=6239 RepID=H2KYJ5_CAEEL|nr:Mitochondrial carrier [Caenorhabditis elegans]CCD63551.1 Mitochondrial carrier [Caenorhabditis elegans]|eukprot:NP_495545.3 MiTochondrial Carrier Homolog [Caenorhabditis elegans]
MAEGNQQDAFLGLAPEEEKFAKSLIAKLALSSLSLPLTVTRTLIQLGHEPFPLSTGKTLVIAGRNAYFLPNFFSYMKQLGTTRGYITLWTGIDSAIAALAVQGIASHRTQQYIDEYYPNIGGPLLNQDKEEDELTDAESFRRVIRNGFRDSVIRVVAVTAARPFAVCFARQVAQVIGNETKYTTCAQALAVIGKQEGPGGLFSGLAPQIVGELLVIWGVHLITHGIQRAILRIEFGDTKNKDETKAKAAKDVHKFIHTAVPFLVNSFGYPYSVVSTVMAVAGSGLAVSFLPYSPSFNNWHGAWDYLRPIGLKRGNRLFLREQVGAVTVGVDQQLYASNSYFA